MLEVMLDEAKRYNEAWWVYVLYKDTTVGVILFDEDGKRLVHESTARSTIYRKLSELGIDKL